MNLTDLQEQKLAAFHADKDMREAVRQVLLAGIYQNGVLKEGEEHDPTQNFALLQVFRSIMTGAPVSNEELGENLRAQACGIQLLEQAFKQISTYVKTPEGGAEDGENPAV